MSSTSNEGSDNDSNVLLDNLQHLRVYLQRMRENESLHDVVFVVENERFPVNRCLVAAASPVLHKMLTNGMKETHQREVVLKEVCADVWRAVLDYTYTCQMELADVERALQILECASRSQMKELEQVITEYIEVFLDECNCCEVLVTVDRIHSETLRKLAMNVLVKNFYDLYYTSDFTELSYILSLEVLKRSDLVVRSELDVFLAAVYWALRSGMNGVDIESNAGIAKRTCQMLRQNDLRIIDMEDFDLGTGDAENFSVLFECVDLNNLSNADLRLTARFCRDLCKEIHSTYNVDIVHIRQFREKAVDKLLAAHNPIPDIPIPLHNRKRHGRYNTVFTFSHRFHDVQKFIGFSGTTKGQCSPIFEDEVWRLKWFVKVHFRGWNEHTRDKFVSCFLYRKDGSSSTKQSEFSYDVYAEVDNNDSLSAPIVFKGNGIWPHKKLIPLSALKRKNKVTIGIALYFTPCD